MRKFKIKLLVIVTVIAFQLGYSRIANAQDTVSTTGVQFKELITPKRAGKQIGNAINLREVRAHKTKITNTGAKQTLWALFGAGFLWGLTAIFMPCIFPMLPFTVSYFTKKAHTRVEAFRMAAVYGLSIIVIYVILGLAVTILFGADTLNSMATNGVFNLVFFALLITFAASFLGAFEITLPSRWVNKMDERSDSGGFSGLFFMAATLALVSFSCTGPLIGTLLVQAAVSGALLAPAVGMFGFSLALALPFTLFAVFPSLLRSMPKSGGWLNRIKVILGFLEMALALKFLSNVDLAYHWKWFDREIFLVLWIVVFALMGLYILGKLRFNHDSETDRLSVSKLFLAIVVFSFTLYMVPGLWGAPLKSISAFLPPQSTQDFDLYTPMLSAPQSATITSDDTITRKYEKLFDKPAGQHPFFDFDQGVAYARSVHKPVMIDFTGHACVNCRKMEANVWTDKAVSQVIRDYFVLIQLYVDDKTDLPRKEQYVSKFSGRPITTVGGRNSDIQAQRFNSNSQPFYVLMDAVNEQPLVTPSGADYDPQHYLSFLKEGLQNNPGQSAP